jgi:hypothetical protein
MRHSSAFTSTWRTVFFIGFFLGFLLALALYPRTASAQTSDDIINKYIAARGGLAKIRSVKSERVSGTISFGPGADGPFLVERKRPLKMHMEITITGKTLIRTYDGKSTGWIYNPFGPTPSVTAMSEADLRGVFDEADFEGPFVDYKTKGNKIEYVGREDVEGKSDYKLKLTNKNSDTSFFLFDPDTYLISKWEGTRKVGDKDVPWESFFRDFREVDGLKYPFLIESDAPGTEQIQKIAADKIEVNVPIEDSRFGKPTPPVTPPAPASTPADPAKPQ